VPIHPEGPIRRRRFHLHCSCGASFTSSESTATCSECGTTVTFRPATLLQHKRIVAIRFLSKELLLIIGWSLFVALMGYFAGMGSAILALFATVIAFAIRKPDFSRSRMPARMSPDPNVRYRWMGRTILVTATLLALVYLAPGSNYEEWMAVARHPKPRDCDFAAWPFGDKHCHYEPSFNPSSEGGEKLTVNWNRMSD
jgi:hypothetical protein